MVDPPNKRIELYLKGLASEIQSQATSANLDKIQDIQCLAHRLTDQAVEQNRLPSCISAITTATSSATPATPSDNKRKWDGYSSKGLATVQSQAQQQRKNSDHQSTAKAKDSGVHDLQIGIAGSNSQQKSYAKKRLFAFLVLVQNLSKFKATRVVPWLASPLS